MAQRVPCIKNAPNVHYTKFFICYFELDSILVTGRHYSERSGSILWQEGIILKGLEVSCDRKALFWKVWKYLVTGRHYSERSGSILWQEGIILKGLEVTSLIFIRIVGVPPTTGSRWGRGDRWLTSLQMDGILVSIITFTGSQIRL